MFFNGSGLKLLKTNLSGNLGSVCSQSSQSSDMLGMILIEFNALKLRVLSIISYVARKKITPLYMVYWTLHDHSGMAEILLIEHKTPNNQASYQSDNDSRVQMLPPKSDLYSSISAMYKYEFVFFLPYLC